MQTFEKSGWPAQHHVESWDNMLNSGKQHGMALYMRVYNMCLNGELLWAAKQAEAYVDAYLVCLNPFQTQMEHTHNIAVLSRGIRSHDHRLRKYVRMTENIMTGILAKHLNIGTIHEANILLTKMCLSCINMKMQ